MALIVQKYGGTSVATVERMQRVADHIAATARAGNQLVVVVSAMGDETDRLKALAYEIAERPSLRELDVLLTAGERVSMSLMSIGLNALSIPCVSFTGSQSGIITDTQHGNARIQNILGDRIQAALDEGKVAIVAGFQGMAMPTKDITTLGRGGSDLTAVALAHRLKANLCEIYTDVDGIYNADPRYFPRAKLIQNLNHSELSNLAWAGAGVVHTRAAQLAAKYKIPLRIRSSFNLSHNGTTISTSEGEGTKMEKAEVIAVTSQNKLSLATLTVPGKQAIANIYRELNAFFWSQDSVPSLQNYLSEPTHIGIQVAFDRRKFADFTAMMQEKFNATCENKDAVCCINVVGRGFLQDQELVCSLLDEVSEEAIAFHKANDLLKIIVPENAGAAMVERLQTKFL